MAVFQLASTGTTVWLYSPFHSPPDPTCFNPARFVVPYQ